MINTTISFSKETCYVLETVRWLHNISDGHATVPENLWHTKNTEIRKSYALI